MRIILALLLFASVGMASEKQRVIDIYIYETRRLDGTVTFYSWVQDSGGGDCEVESDVPEITIGWLQSGSMYIENKGGKDGKGVDTQTMVLVSIAEKSDRFADHGVGAPVKISFGKINGGGWDGKIHIEIPYKSKYKIQRAVNIKKEIK